MCNCSLVDEEMEHLRPIVDEKNDLTTQTERVGPTKQKNSVVK